MHPSPHRATMWLLKMVCLSVLNCAAAILAAAAIPAALAIPCGFTYEKIKGHGTDKTRWHGLIHTLGLKPQESCDRLHWTVNYNTAAISTTINFSRDLFLASLLPRMYQQQCERKQERHRNQLRTKIRNEFKRQLQESYVDQEAYKQQ